MTTEWGCDRKEQNIAQYVQSYVSGEKIPKEFWADAIEMAAYLYNRTTFSSIPPNKTPYELWHNVRLDVQPLRILGATCWYHINNAQNSKLGNQGRRGMLPAFTESRNAYKLYDFDLKKPSFREMFCLTIQRFSGKFVLSLHNRTVLQLLSFLSARSL